MELVCKKCGSLDYHKEIKGVHLGAYCDHCGEWITWIAQEKPKFHFGKYKGHEVESVSDIGYLEWLLKELKLTANMKKAIQERINHIKNYHS